MNIGLYIRYWLYEYRPIYPLLTIWIGIGLYIPYIIHLAQLSNLIGPFVPRDRPEKNDIGRLALTSTQKRSVKSSCGKIAQSKVSDLYKGATVANLGR